MPRSPSICRPGNRIWPRLTAIFHIAFNVATAILFIGVLDALARLLTWLLPDRVQAADPARPRYLDESALETPSLALADAARETLRAGDMVETMLRNVMTAMMTNDRALVDQVSRMDNAVDGLDEAIRLYLTKLTRGSLDEREGRRAMEIIAFAINLEHIGDIVDKNLSELAVKKIKRRLQFSADGAEELSAFHRRIMELLRMAFGVFMSGDVGEAHRLLAEKAALRNVELAATERHLERLREGRPESLETTSLHLDVLRDLKRIHSHICSVAYPVLEAAGELEASRTASRAIAAARLRGACHAPGFASESAFGEQLVADIARGRASGGCRAACASRRGRSPACRRWRDGRRPFWR